MKKIIFALLVVLSVAKPGQAKEHALLTQVLGTHVQDGKVDYLNLCKDPRLSQYLETLSQEDPRRINDRQQQLAFWINAYNAFTLKLICDNYPLKSINQLHAGGLIIGSVLGQTAWDRKFITINNKTYSLGGIEHKIIRPRFQEPRIHYAIVCAAKGCPPLRSEAYEATTLDDQLNDQGTTFLRQGEKNRFDLTTRTAYISPIFSWFKKDFGGRPSEVLQFLAAFLPEGIQKDINANADKWKIQYTPYDWTLNE